MNTTKLLIIAFALGFFGDLITQLIVKSNRFGNWGLNNYFAKHGVMESAFIAAGVVVGFYAFWIGLGLPLKWQFILPVAIVLDFMWNKAHIFPSLDEYYKQPWFMRTILGVVIPFILPLILVRII